MVVMDVRLLAAAARRNSSLNKDRDIDGWKDRWMICLRWCLAVVGTLLISNDQ